MAPKAVLPILLALLLAGCAVDAPAQTKAPAPPANMAQFEDGAWPACPAAPPPAVPSGNAPRLPAFLEPRERMAQRIAAVLGLALEGVAPEAVEPGGLRWKAPGGEILVWDEPITRVRFHLDRPWPAPAADASREDLAALLRAVGLPDGLPIYVNAGDADATRWHDASAGLLFSAMRIDPFLSVRRHFATPPPPTDEGWATVGDLGAIHDLRGARVDVPAGLAFEEARRHVECASGVAARGGLPMGLEVRDDSLVHAVTVLYPTGYAPDLACDARAWAYVDALTGSVLDVRPPTCV